MKGENIVQQTLQILSDSTRRRIIQVIGSNRMTFSELMRGIGLSPEHDSGPFTYHLSKLTEGKILLKAENYYELTEFGLGVGEVIDVLERECFFLVEEIPESITRRTEEDVLIRWTATPSYSDIESNFKTVKDYPDAPEEDILNIKQFREWAKPNEHGFMYLEALHRKKLLAILTIRPIVNDWIGKKMGNKGQADETFHRKYTCLLIENILVIEGKPEMRHQALLQLFRYLIEEAKNHATDVIWIPHLDAFDRELLLTTKETGFRKGGTSYEMRINLQAKPFLEKIYVPTRFRKDYRRWRGWKTSPLE